jgi:hypothetical protein
MALIMIMTLTRGEGPGTGGMFISSLLRGLPCLAALREDLPKAGGGGMSIADQVI